MTDIKPCPKCGSTKVKVEGYGYKKNAFVWCQKCFHRGPDAEESKRDDDTEAMRLWNERGEQ